MRLPDADPGTGLPDHVYGPGGEPEPRRPSARASLFPAGKAALVRCAHHRPAGKAALVRCAHHRPAGVRKAAGARKAVARSTGGNDFLSYRAPEVDVLP